MKPSAYRLVFVAVLSVFTLLITALLVSNAAAQAQETTQKGMASATEGSAGCLDALPRIKWLGQGEGAYVLEDAYDRFIVKRLPFTFVLEQGEQNSSDQLTYQAAAKERVWACAGACQLPAVYHAEYEIGQFDAGTHLNLVVIDDDPDERRNWWAADEPTVPYQVVDEQQMVEYLDFTVPFTATWYYYAADSIGIAATCVEAPIVVTPNTPTPISTPTDTPMPPTSTPTTTSTPTDAATPLTNTPTTPSTPTDTPVSPTSTPLPPLPPEPPTALDPTEEPSVSSPTLLYLPLTMN